MRGGGRIGDNVDIDDEGTTGGGTSSSVTDASATAATASMASGGSITIPEEGNGAVTAKAISNDELEAEVMNRVMGQAITATPIAEESGMAQQQRELEEKQRLAAAATAKREREQQQKRNVFGGCFVLIAIIVLIFQRFSRPWITFSNQ